MRQVLSKPLALKGWVLFSALLALLIFSIIGAFFYDNILAWMAGLAYIIYDTGLLLYIAWKTRHIDRKPTEKLHSNSATDNNSVGVLVPIHNEESGVIATLEALLKQESPLKQIIVIDDGSTDNSISVLNQTYDFEKKAQGLALSKTQPQLFLLTKPNSGKADSLNQALAHITCDIVISVDADTLLSDNAITAIKAAFDNNPKMVSAGGILTPMTKGGLFAKTLGLLQYFEYALSYLSRAAWGATNSLLLVSGAFAAYRKTALEAVGGFDVNSLVEDYELTHRMHHYAHTHDLNWEISTLGQAQGSTDAPATIKAFIQQRKRWFSGFLRTHYQYRQMIGNASYRSIGVFMLPIKTIDTLQPIYGLVAFLALIGLILTDSAISHSILIALLIKLVIDYLYHIWALHKYYGWIGQPATWSQWLKMTLCCLIAPIFFQPLRHLAAFIGWTQAMNKEAKWQPLRHQPRNIH